MHDVTGRSRLTVPEPRMSSNAEHARIPDERLSIEQRKDGTLVVRVQSQGPEGLRLPDAKFSFRCGDPQYAYWLGRYQAQGGGRG
jgi:hypothetical protein